MTRTLTSLAVVLLATVPYAVGQDASIDGLSWLSGCWRSEANGGTVIIDEYWMPPKAGQMLAVSRTVSGGRVVGHEFLRIEVRGDAVVFVANPSGQAETEFVRDPGPDTDLVFRNPDHDFPQAVRYRKAGPDSVVAEISGPRDGETRRIEIPLRRVACDNREP